MRKNKNMKKRTIYTVLLIVIAVLVVGYAVLSSALNIFGGLGIIPGDLGWGVKWSNLEVNSESNATVNTAPTLANDDTSVNFVVTLDQPGKFYEFTVDAVNTGTMDAMIDGVNTTIYNSEDEEVYPDYLNYSVEYANGVIVTPGHLLRAGESVKYKVRIEFSNDITVEDLPKEEQQLRFEFGVTYIQADESAYEPGTESNNTLQFVYINHDRTINYDFTDGMTWSEWIESDYNADSFYLDGENVKSFSGSNLVDSEGNIQNPDDMILSDEEYHDQ